MRRCVRVELALVAMHAMRAGERVLQLTAVCNCTAGQMANRPNGL